MLRLPLANSDSTFNPPSPDSMHIADLITGTGFTKLHVLVILSVIIIFGLFYWMSKKQAMVPSKSQFLGESAYGFIRNSMAKDIIGAPEFRKYVPLLFTFFYFILLNNIYGAIPFIELPTFSHAGAAYAVALIAYITWIVAGVKKFGLGKFLKNMTVPAGVPWYLLILVTPIEIISNFLVRPVTQSLRLFATMFAGHLVIMLGAEGIRFLLHTGEIWLQATSVLVFAGTFGMYLLEILIMLLQAYVFTMLTSMYIQGAISEDH